MISSLVNLRLENASLNLIGERVTPAVQRYHVEPDGQADRQSLWLLHSSPLRSKLEARILSYYLSSTRAILIYR